MFPIMLYKGIEHALKEFDFTGHYMVQIEISEGEFDPNVLIEKAKISISSSPLFSGHLSHVMYHKARKINV